MILGGAGWLSLLSSAVIVLANSLGHLTGAMVAQSHAIFAGTCGCKVMLAKSRRSFAQTATALRYKITATNTLALH